MSGLFRPLTADEIEVRVNKITDSFTELLIYKTARTDAKLLDEVFSTMGWKKNYKSIDGKVVCCVSAWDKEKNMWIEKEDTGVPSYADAQKGEFSDAFKRAGFAWGIGRELYTAPMIKVWNSDSQGALNIQTKNRNDGKVTTYDEFSVEKIAYSEDGEYVIGIAIKNDTLNKRIFVWQKPIKPNDGKE